MKPIWSPKARAAIVRSYEDALAIPKPAEAEAATMWVREQFRFQTMAFYGIRDPDPRVRLEGVRLLAHIKSPTAVERALGVLEQPMDRVLDYALWLTVRELEPYWLPEFQAGRLTFVGDAKKLAFALNAIGNKDTVKPVLALIDGGKVPKENVHGLYLLLSQIGGPNELTRVLTHAGAADTPAAQRAELAQAVETAVRTRNVAAPKGASALAPLMSGDGAARRTAMRVAGLWKLSEETGKDIAAFALDPKTSTEDRRAAFDGLFAMGGVWLGVALDKGLAQHAPAHVKRDAVTAYAAANPANAVTSAVNFLEDARPEEELGDLFAGFLGKKGGGSVLAKALSGKKLPPDVARIGLKAVRASGQPADDLVAALTKAGSLDAPRKPPTDAEVKALAVDAMKTGDAARGERVYRRRELQCLACHAYGGAGGQVGPDLTSIGASAQPDYLVDSLLLPHKAIKEGFDVTRVVTNDDKVLQGIRVREADGVLVLRTAEDKELAVPVKDIAERGKSTKSLMPEGLTDQLTKQDFADLVKYLSELGKVGGPYAPSKARVVRRWQVIESTPANLNAFRRARVSAAAEAGDGFAWSPAYAKVPGELPLDDLPKFVVWSDTAPQSVVRFQLDVTTAGAAKLKFNSVAGLTVYIGNAPVEAKPETALDLKAGVQTVTLLVDRSARTDDVRVELEDVDGSPARVAVVGGK